LNQFTLDFQYYYKIQGFIYSLLRNSSFEDLHNKKGYKFFCFSNIFARATTKDSSYYLIIASPSSRFLEQITYQLKKMTEYQIPIEIGKSILELQDFGVIPNKNLIFPLRIITGSPIIIRIPLNKFEEQSENLARYASIYWRSSHPLYLFIDALELNLKKKYHEFTDSQINGRRLFKDFKFKKQVSTKLQLGNTKIVFIGTMWEFVFSEIISREVQLFALDCGLGERNSLGFGFMNVIPNKKRLIA